MDDWRKPSRFARIIASFVALFFLVLAFFQGMAGV